MNLKFQFVGGSEIIEEEIQVAFGLQNFFTNVGGFLGLYLGCSVISVIEIFYFIFEFLQRKLTGRQNRIEPIYQWYKLEEISNEEDESLMNQDMGLTLAKIFDLEEFFQ